MKCNAICHGLAIGQTLDVKTTGTENGRMYFHLAHIKGQMLECTNTQMTQMHFYRRVPGHIW